MYTDETLNCVDCSAPFTFSTGEQEFFASKGFTNKPNRCPDCRAARKAQRAGGGGGGGSYGGNGGGGGGYGGAARPQRDEAVHAELGRSIPLILDGGECGVGLESSVLYVSERTPVLLRAGGIPIEEIEEITGPVRHGAPVEERPLAPGQLKSHYAPRKPLTLVADATKVPSRADVGWLAFGAVTQKSAGVIENVSPGGDLREAATNFFRAMRALDDNPQVSELYAARFPERSLGHAINERLERAAG